MPLPKRYHTEFGHSKSNHMGVLWGGKNSGGRWGPNPFRWGVVDPIVPLCYLAKFDRFRSNSTSIITEIRQKNLTHGTV